MNVAGVLFLVVCATPASPRTTTSSTYWPTHTWRRSSPERQGINSEGLLKIFGYIQEKNPDVHSIIVVRNGYIVLEAYFYPYEKNWLHDVASVTKSITSLVTGIVIDEGYIRSVNEPALSFFKDRSLARLEEDKKSLTIEHLLTMTSGFCRNIEEGEEQPGRMRASADGVQFMLDQPLVSKPGSEFVYCSLAPHFLSAIITRATGMSLLDFARKHLFGPLGIESLIWPADPQGNSYGWGDLFIHPIDLAKVGYLLSNEGSWGGKQVISREWVRLLSTPHVFESGGTGYGYLWWMPKEWPGLYEGRGRGGQRFAVWPQKNLVVVVIGSGGYNLVGDIRALVIQAMQSDGPLPENPEALKLLEKKIEDAYKQPAPEPAAPLPSIAHEISGKKYSLDSNPLGLKSFTLVLEKGNEALLRFSSREQDNKVVPVGLDGVYRISNTSRFNLPAAAKGSWVTDHDFDLVYNEAANNRIFHFRMHFEGSTAEWRVTETTGLIAPTTIKARVQP